MTSIIPCLPYLWEEICGTAPAPTPAPTPEPTPTPTPTPPPAAPGPQFTGNGGAPATISVEEGAVDVYRFFTIHGEAPFLWSVSGGPAAVVINSFGVLRYLTGMPLLTNPLVVVVRVSDRLGRFDEQQLTIEVRPKVIVNPSPSRLTFGAILGDPMVGNTLTYVPDTWANATSVTRRWTMDGLDMGEASVPLLLIDLQAYSKVGVRSTATGPGGTTVETIEMAGTVGQVTGVAPASTEAFSAALPAKVLAPGDTPQPIPGGLEFSSVTNMARVAGGGLVTNSTDAMAYGWTTLPVARNARHRLRWTNLANTLRAEFGICVGPGWLGKGGVATGYMIKLDRNWQPTGPLRLVLVKHNGDGLEGTVFTEETVISATATRVDVDVTIDPQKWVVTVTPDAGDPVTYTITDTLYRTPTVQIGNVVAGTATSRTRTTFELGIGEAANPIPQSDRYQLIWAEEFNDPALPNWKEGLEWDDTINGETQSYGAGIYEVAQSILTIIARRTSAPGDPQVWISDALTTFDKVGHQYGVIEWRMRLPRGMGAWIAAWLMSIFDTWPGHEIDVAEHDGGRPTRLSHALHQVDPLTGNDVASGQFPTIPYDGEIDDWLTVSVEWLPSGRMIFRTHNVTTWDTTHNIHSRNYLLANLAIAPVGQPDFWVTNPDETTPAELRFDIDYIRWWRRPSQVANLPVVDSEPEISQAGNTLTVQHGVSNAVTVRGVLRTGNSGAREVPGTAVTRTGASTAPTTIDLLAVPTGKINWYEEHRSASGGILQTASYPWIWWEQPSGSADEIEVTGVTAQAPGNSFVPAGYTGPWAYLRNVFAPGGLTDGVDYTLRQWRDPAASWPSKFRFEWMFPAANPAPSEFCWGYPALMWGAGPWGYPYGTSGHVTPMRAKDVGTFTIDVDLTFSGANNADVLIDFYVLKGASGPVFDGDYFNEISILLSHNGVGPIDWLTTEATATHTFPAPLGDCAIYKQPTSRQIMIMPRTGSTRREALYDEIDCGSVIKELIRIGQVEGNGWLAGFEIGVETQRPNAWNSAPYSGSFRFNTAPVVSWLQGALPDNDYPVPSAMPTWAALTGDALNTINPVTWTSETPITDAGSRLLVNGEPIYIPAPLTPKAISTSAGWVQAGAVLSVPDGDGWVTLSKGSAASGELAYAPVSPVTSFTQTVIELRAGSVATAHVGLFGANAWSDGTTTCYAKVVRGPGSVTKFTGALFTVAGLSATESTYLHIVRKVANTDSVRIYPGSFDSTTSGASIKVRKLTATSIDSGVTYGREFYVDSNGLLTSVYLSSAEAATAVYEQHATNDIGTRRVRTNGTTQDTPDAAPTGMRYLSALNYENQPDLAPYGIERIEVIYEQELFPGVPRADRDWPIPAAGIAAFDARVAAAGPNDIICVDFEFEKPTLMMYPWTKQEIFRGMVSVFRDFAVLLKSRMKPGQKLGFYGYFPTDNPLPNAGVAEHVHPRNEMVQHNTWMAPVIAEVDFLAPCTYLSGTYTGTQRPGDAGVLNGELDSRVETVIRSIASEANRIAPDLPCYLFISPETQNTQTQQYPALNYAAFKRQLDIMGSTTLAGPILWGGYDIGSPPRETDGDIQLEWPGASSWFMQAIADKKDGL